MEFVVSEMGVMLLPVEVLLLFDELLLSVAVAMLREVGMSA